MPLGNASPEWFTSWLTMVTAQLVVGAPPVVPIVAYDGIAMEAAGGTPADGLFGLYVGPQHLRRFTGADTCVLVPSYGEPSQPIAFRTTGSRRVIGATSLGVEIHIWGREPTETEELSQATIEWDIARYSSASEIYQNVLRAFCLATPGGVMTLGPVDGWQNDTEIQRHGEALIARLAVTFPIYDFDETQIQLPQALEPSVRIEEPG